MVLVSYVAVGVSPRTIGRQHPLNTATAAAYVLLPLARVMGPIPQLLILIGNALTPGKGFRKGPFASEAELRALVDLAEKESLIEDEERRMVHSVFELGDTLVREVMVPRTDLVVIERYKTIRQALTLALRSGFSRIPVTGENEDDIVGIVYLKDLARKTHISRDAETELVSTAMRPATFVPDTKNAGDLLREMQQDRNHVAVVIDEYGGTAGIVTIEDILEEIVGEITDEYDRELPPVAGPRRRPLPGHRPPRHRRPRRAVRLRGVRRRGRGDGRRSARQGPRPGADRRAPPSVVGLPDRPRTAADGGGLGGPPEQDRHGARRAGGPDGTAGTDEEEEAGVTPAGSCARSVCPSTRPSRTSPSARRPRSSRCWASSSP